MQKLVLLELILGRKGRRALGTAKWPTCTGQCGRGRSRVGYGEVTILGTGRQLGVKGVHVLLQGLEGLTSFLTLRTFYEIFGGRAVLLFLYRAVREGGCWKGKILLVLLSRGAGICLRRVFLNSATTYRLSFGKPFFLTIIITCAN